MHQAVAAVAVLAVAGISYGVSTALTAGPGKSPPRTAEVTSTTTTSTTTTPTTTTSIAVVAAPTTFCTPHDLKFTTTTDRAAYALGQSVKLVTRVTDVKRCTFQPVASDTAPCPVQLMVVASGTEVWPYVGQPVQCNPPLAMNMKPGAVETLSATWNGRTLVGNTIEDGPAGSYTAVGTWSWSSGNQRPYAVIVSSSTFTVS